MPSPYPVGRVAAMGSCPTCLAASHPLLPGTGQRRQDFSRSFWPVPGLTSKSTHNSIGVKRPSASLTKRCFSSVRVTRFRALA